MTKHEANRLAAVEAQAMLPMIDLIRGGVKPSGNKEAATKVYICFHIYIYIWIYICICIHIYLFIYLCKPMLDLIRGGVKPSAAKEAEVNVGLIYR